MKIFAGITLTLLLLVTLSKAQVAAWLKQGAFYAVSKEDLDLARSLMVEGDIEAGAKLITQGKLSAPLSYPKRIYVLDSNWFGSPWSFHFKGRYHEVLDDPRFYSPAKT